MEKQLPKNVKQIGNISDNPKIYVEDYVDTYLNQICEGEESPVAAFLVGETGKQEDQDYIYIYGAVRASEFEMKDNAPDFTDEHVKKAEEEKEQYFKEGEWVGWFLAVPGQPIELNENIVKIHEKTFPKVNTVFIKREPSTKEEMFFSFKLHDLMEMGGHYIYYEKNPNMQSYMIATRKENGVTPSEVVEDRAAKDFRSVVREKLEKSKEQQRAHLSYTTSAAMILIALVIGVAMVNNYDKMQSLQNSLSVISNAVSANEDTDNKSGVSKQDKETSEGSKQPASTESQEPTGQTSQPVSEIEQEGQAVQASQGADAVVGVDDIYIVQKGDTLASISKKVYGDTSQIDAICKMNGLQDGNLIFIGEKLLLP